jgi:hypothetical protein
MRALDIRHFYLFNSDFDSPRGIESERERDDVLSISAVVLAQDYAISTIKGAHTNTRIVNNATAEREVLIAELTCSRLSGVNGE